MLAGGGKVVSCGDADKEGWESGLQRGRRRRMMASRR